MVRELSPENQRSNLLLTLASKGGDTVRIVILAVVLVNGIQGWKTNQSVDFSRTEVARQIKVIYNNQKVIAAYWTHATKEHDLMLKKFGIPQPDETPVPKLYNLPEFDKDGNGNKDEK